MKRTSSIAFCILMLCSLLLFVNIGTIKAAEPGYSITEWWGRTPTVDGKWTTAGEWHDTSVQRMGTPQVAIFEFKVDASADFTEIYMNYLIEFADRTTDAGDRWQICLGAPSTATAPSSTDNKFEIEGHTTLKTYVGTGTGWTLTTNPAGVTWKDNLTTSPHDPATHYVLEFRFNKMQYGWGAVAPPQGLRIAMYDASNPAQGWVAWPPEAISKDNPSRWGQIATYSMDPYPEGLTIGVMVLLSSVAVIVSTWYFRKQPRIKSYSSVKL